MKKLYKVHCEFYMKANNEDDVEQRIDEDYEFIQSHVMVDQIEKLPEGESIYETL